MNVQGSVLVSTTSSTELPLPALIANAGDRAALRFPEYFTVNIRNRNTPAAYGRAAADFLNWREGQKRYSPAECTGCERKPIKGNPDPKQISTSYAERQNLTVGMHNRRFTRLTNAFPKKVGNHLASLAIHYMHYNFVRVHQSLRMTPAMAAGVTAHLWDIADLIALVN
jgi:hypothetical protein